MKIGAREAEHDADVGFGQHDRIYEHAAVGVLECNDERYEEVATEDAPDDVGTRHLVEDRADHFDPLDRAPLAPRVQVAAHLAGDVRDARVQIAPRRAEAHIAEQILDEQRERAVIEVAVGADGRMEVREWIEVGGDEFDVGRDADDAEQLAADGAEEGLGELWVGERHDLRGELAADLAPQGAVGCLRTEREA